ncbi:MAG: DMT family transporter [Candidatus Thermoplasmatota archaeon]|nr:DMT family transporter [Candidatus Thermoplasmatota archaeon]
MELLWLPFSIATIILYGLGQVFVKETRTQISSANYLLLFSVNIFAMWAAYWLLFHEKGAYDGWIWVQAIAAAALSGAAYITYYEALKHGKVSILGTIAGAYAPWTVFLALIFLGEDMSIGEGAGVVLVVSAMLIFTYAPTKGNGNKKLELLGILLAVASLFFWGTSAMVAKGAINEMGDTNFIGVYAVVCPVMWTIYWLVTTKGKFEMPKANLKILEISMLFLAAGGITLYLAFAHGNVSIVSPITNLYPILTIAVAKFRLKEQLNIKQYAALAMLLAAVPLFSL